MVLHHTIQFTKCYQAVLFRIRWIWQGRSPEYGKRYHFGKHVDFSRWTILRSFWQLKYVTNMQTVSVSHVMNVSPWSIDMYTCLYACVHVWVLCVCLHICICGFVYDRDSVYACALVHAYGTARACMCAFLCGWVWMGVFTCQFDCVRVMTSEEGCALSWHAYSDEYSLITIAICQTPSEKNYKCVMLPIHYRELQKPHHFIHRTSLH